MIMYILLNIFNKLSQTIPCILWIEATIKINDCIAIIPEKIPQPSVLMHVFEVLLNTDS